MYYRCEVRHTGSHELVGIVRDREDVGWSLHTLLSSVGSYDIRVVHWEPLVGVYSGAEQPRVGLKGRTCYEHLNASVSTSYEYAVFY